HLMRALRRPAQADRLLGQAEHRSRYAAAYHNQISRCLPDRKFDSRWKRRRADMSAGLGIQVRPENLVCDGRRTVGPHIADFGSLSHLCYSWAKSGLDSGGTTMRRKGRRRPNAPAILT